MDDKLTISSLRFFKLFPDAETARIYLESRRWPQGSRCPTCGLLHRVTVRKDGYYRCNQCKEAFTVRTGTVFERSHLPLHKWLYAMYLLVTARKGISSLQLSKHLGITWRSARSVLHRLREACGSELKHLRRIVELDGTDIGRLDANKHASKKQKRGRGRVGKFAVLGMRKRGGRVVAMPVEKVNAANPHRAIHTHLRSPAPQPTRTKMRPIAGTMVSSPVRECVPKRRGRH